MMTVLLATYNGVDTLAETLSAMGNLAAPEGGWKVVIVDNGSTDNTAEIIDRFKERLPITSRFHAKRGKNAALNAGLELLEGDLAVFTDDDTLPREDWLLQLREAAARHPDYDIFGGAIRPLWQAPPDPVILDTVPLGVVYALTGTHWVEGPVRPKRVWGPNMAVRAHIFERFRFDERIGPDGSSNYVMGSETELTVRLALHGYKCWHCPDAVVQHLIQPHQLERAWILQRSRRYGRSIYRGKYRSFTEPVPVVLGYPRYLLRQIGKAAAAVAVARLIGDNKAVLKARWELNSLIGQAEEGRLLERQKRNHVESGITGWRAQNSHRERRGGVDPVDSFRRLRWGRFRRLPFHNFQSRQPPD